MRAAPLALTLGLILLTLPAAQPAGTSAVEVEDLWLEVGGEAAHGLLALPQDEPTARVVVMHGYGHVAESHREHLRVLAAEHGAAAVAMDFRGAGFPLRAGADDTMAATAMLMELYPDPEMPVILYSVSMGTAAASMVLGEMPVFDYWVDNEGLAMLHETWAGATALKPSGNPTAVQAAADIEAECGGSPAVAPACYLERSAATRALEYTALKGVILTHGLHDGLVPYDQGREMVAALRAAGVPADFYTVVRGEPCQEGTTLLGYAGVTCTGLAGHGTESNDAHTLTKLSFDLLHRLVDGDASVAPADRELVVDEGLGTLP